MISQDRRKFLFCLSTASVGLATKPQAVRAEIVETIEKRFAPPPGFARQSSEPGSFAAWLRRLPLKAEAAPVLLHTGATKPRQDVHAAVVDIDVGTRDLQQCADAVMRLRAEWQFATGRSDDIAFNDTGGNMPMRWSRWAAGERPVLDGKRLVWTRRADADRSRASFRRYLDTVFTWAGTASLEKELVPVRPRDVRAGDVVIKGGFPGHAVLVIDVATSASTDERRVLLAQSYMPAQSIHVLKNLTDPALSPWYFIRDGEPVVTPEWTFAAGTLKRWP